jgi:hypothetical protein
MGRGQRRSRQGGLQSMGGKEERTSEVGRARARVERREAQGEARFDIDPGPSTEELLHGRGRRPGPHDDDKPRRSVSARRRGGPRGLEPEDKG